MDNDKLYFIKEKMFVLLSDLSETTPAKWGKMNAQQMVEHLKGFFDVSTEKIRFELVTPEAHLPKYREFLYSDKIFKENTKAPAAVLGEEPLPIRYPSLNAAIEKLHVAAADFISYFENSPGIQTQHPVFGSLNFDEWVLLHYKHVIHHLAQFGLV